MVVFDAGLLEHVRRRQAVAPEQRRVLLEQRRRQPGFADDVGADDEQAAGQAAERFDHPHEPPLGVLVRAAVCVVVGRPPDPGAGCRAGERVVAGLQEPAEVRVAVHAHLRLGLGGEQQHQHASPNSDSCTGASIGRLRNVSTAVWWPVVAVAERLAGMPQGDQVPALMRDRLAGALDPARALHRLETVLGDPVADLHHPASNSRSCGSASRLTVAANSRPQSRHAFVHSPGTPC